MSVLALFLLSFAAFPTNVRNQIKREANGRCDACGLMVGKDNLIAAHIFHGKEKKYNRRENGRAHCDFCEAEYHLSFSANPELIGLHKKQNDSVVYGHVMSLPEHQQLRLQSRYAKEWSAVLRRMGK